MPPTEPSETEPAVNEPAVSQTVVAEPPATDPSVAESAVDDVDLNSVDPSVEEPAADAADLSAVSLSTSVAEILVLFQSTAQPDQSIDTLGLSSSADHQNDSILDSEGLTKAPVEDILKNNHSHLPLHRLLLLLLLAPKAGAALLLPEVLVVPLL